MRVVPNWHVESYRPLVQAVLHLYKPEYILELGIGFFSTKLFKDYNYRGIENDPQWIHKVKQLYKGIRIDYHELLGITHITQRKEVPQERLDEINRYYEGLRIPDLHPNLLFVDNYSCCRVLAINVLKDNFDLIIYHDCEPGSAEINYPDINADGFKVMYLTTPHNWTGLMYKEDRGIGKVIDIYESDFKIEYRQHRGIEFNLKYN